MFGSPAPCYPQSMKLIVFLLLALPALASPIWVNKGEAPKGLIRSGYRDTGSMRPALTGDGFYWYLPYSEGVALKAGDWVWVKRASDGMNVIHVVTALNKRAVLTSGLANRWSDGWSPRSNIVGICLYVERKPVTSVAQVSAALR